MSSNNQRIFLHISMPSGKDSETTKKVDSTYLRFNNVLMGDEELPNISKICDYCDNVNAKLGAYIRNRCLDIRREHTFFEPGLNKPNSMLNVIESSERKKIRILLYPGERDDINDLNMRDTTHNMIIQFDHSQNCFRATDPHANPPSFYQTCNSEENALLYLEALMVDACICHYLSVSDVALHHDDKQRISSEKVLFLRELVERKDTAFLSLGGQKLVEYVAEQLTDTTPYISFLSIFTIAPMDCFPNVCCNFLAYFEDYCRLWSEFQIWYFDRHGRVFSKKRKITNPLETIFDRNKYEGQISLCEIIKKLQNILCTFSCKTFNKPFGLELRYAVVIIKHLPESEEKKQRFNALFSGQLHQAKWDIVFWKDIEKYDNIMSYLEIVPFMIIDE